MPFITEEIWQSLPHNGESITVAAWPTVNEELTDNHAASEMKLLVEVIRAVRNIRSEVNTPMSKQIEMQIKAKDEDVLNQLETNRAYVERFCNTSSLTIATNLSSSEKSMTAVVTGAEIILPIEGLINIEEEINRLEKEREKLDKEVERVQKKLGNEGFLKKAPEKVIEEEKAKAKDYLEKRDIVLARIKELRG
jgi:valyl-tRNA synthetase